MKIKVKKTNYFVKLPKIINKGEWIDLYSAAEISLNAPQAKTLKYHTVNGEKEGHRDVEFDWHLIPLGVAMKLPKGFEAVMIPRSSTFKSYGIMEANSMGLIDNSYCGNNDEWRFPAIAFRDTVIPEGTRLCQFRIQLSQKATVWQKLRWLFSSKIEIEEVETLDGPDRGGFGSTGNM